MSLSITTLNNRSAAAKTFTLIRRDPVAEWVNSDDSNATFDQRIKVRHEDITDKNSGIKHRRTNVQLTAVRPTDIVLGNGNTRTIEETFTVNFTMSGPKNLATLTDNDRKDVIAYLISFLGVSGMQTALLRGELA